MIKSSTKKVLHFIDLKGLGGVQQSFIPYYRMAKEKSLFKHSVCGSATPDREFYDLPEYSCVKTSFKARLDLIKAISSKNTIVHFYNNMAGRNINRLLNILPCKKIIFHERGIAWNIKRNDAQTYLNNAKKAKLILSNSSASKSMLVNKFGIDENKVKVLHNGFWSSHFKGIKRENGDITVGYIGRLDTHKGVETLLKAALRMQDIKFLIAGTGPLEEYLINKYQHKNISFIGRKKPEDFFQLIDLLVVPSIREPLGNVAIEAGFFSLPVIAANIDGLPEIIDENSGILIEPTEKPNRYDEIEKALDLPEYVINPESGRLTKPLQLNIDTLIDKITSLVYNESERLRLGNNLYNKVSEKFSIEAYFQNLEQIYLNLFGE